MAKNLDPIEKEAIVQLIIDYYANPFDERTQGSFIDALQISVETFYKIKREFHDRIFTEAAKRFEKAKPELRSMGYRALAQRLKKSDNAAKLLFQLLGDLVERTESTVKYTPDEKRARIEELTRRFGIPAKVNHDDKSN